MPNEMLEAMEPCMSTRALDAFIARLLERQGARAALQLTSDFPGAT